MPPNRLVIVLPVAQKEGKEGGVARHSYHILGTVYIVSLKQIPEVGYKSAKAA